MLEGTLYDGTISIDRCASLLGQLIQNNGSLCLIGAGISYDTPSCLPLGDQLKQRIFYELCPVALTDSEVRVRFADWCNTIRPEVALEIVSRSWFEPLTKVLQPFASNMPNLNHYILTRLTQIARLDPAASAGSRY